MPPTERVRRAEISAYLVAIAGAAALLAFGLFSAFGQPFGTLNDLLLLAMTLTIAPINFTVPATGTPADLVIGYDTGIR